MSEYIVNLSGDWASKQGEKLTEIVRCKDCRFSIAKGYGYGRGNEEYLDVEPDGFCAWGERSRE